MQVFLGIDYLWRLPYMRRFAAICGRFGHQADAGAQNGREWFDWLIAVTGAEAELPPTLACRLWSVEFPSGTATADTIAAAAASTPLGSWFVVGRSRSLVPRNVVLRSLLLAASIQLLEGPLA